MLHSLQIPANIRENRHWRVWVNLKRILTESWSKSSSIDLEESRQEEIFQVSQIWKIAGMGKGQLLLQIVKHEKSVLNHLSWSWMIQIWAFEYVRGSAEKYRASFCTGWLALSEMHSKQSKQISCCYLYSCCYL